MYSTVAVTIVAVLLGEKREWESQGSGWLVGGVFVENNNDDNNNKSKDQ